MIPWSGDLFKLSKNGSFGSTAVLKYSYRRFGASKKALFTKAGDPARFVVIGQREGVAIKVVLEPAGEGIITAHPLP